MSGPPCKAVLCLENAAATAKRAAQQVNRGDYTEEEFENLRICAEIFIKDVMKIAEG